MDYTYIDYEESWQSLSWLNKWLKYLPMVTSKSPTKKPRKYEYYISIYVAITMCCMAAMAVCRLWRSYLGFDPHNWIFDVTWIVANAVDFVSRCFSMYYYYIYFQYPWYGRDNIQIREIHSIHFGKKIKYNCKVIRLLFWITILFYTIGFFHEYEFRSADPKLDTNLGLAPWIQYALVFLTFITSFVPRVVTFSVVAAVFLKYNIYLLQLTDSISSKDKYYKINYKDILQEYKKIYSQFDNDYHISLKCSIQICLFGLILFTWRNIYHIVEGKFMFFFLIGGNVLVALLLVLYGLLLTQSYDAFKKLLFESGGWYIGNKKYLLNRMDYQYTMDYVEKHSMEITLGKITVTKSNIIKFFVAFGIARYFAHIGEILYNKADI
eukprot:541005_1